MEIKLRMRLMFSVSVSTTILYYIALINVAIVIAAGQHN